MLSSPQSRSAFESEDVSEHNSVHSADHQFESNLLQSPPKQQRPQTAADGFSNELTKLQEEQILYVKKIEREKQRHVELAAAIEEAKLRLRLIRSKTKNGNIVKDYEVTNKKLVSRLEYQLQQSKIKLSTARNDNIKYKGRVHDLRMDKLLHLQIYNDVLHEIADAKRRSKYCQKEILSLNEKKHKVKVAIAGLQQQMVKDIEKFSSDLAQAKQNITVAQANIMNTVKEKLQTSSIEFSPSGTVQRPPTASGAIYSAFGRGMFGNNNHNENANNNMENFEYIDIGRPSTGMKTMRRPHTAAPSGGGGASRPRTSAYSQKANNNSRGATSRPGTMKASPVAGSYAEQQYSVSSGATPSPRDPAALLSARPVGHTAQEAEFWLRDTEFNTVEELLHALQFSEEQVFKLYHETQNKHEEVEKMELENKHLEIRVQEQMKKLHNLEGNQQHIQQELEKNIQYFQSMIAKYDLDFDKNMELVKNVSDNLMKLLTSVAKDEAVLDQQILSTGVTDRNIPDLLGLVEERIDDLIQMLKAANHQKLVKEDFLKVTSPAGGAAHHHGSKAGHASVLSSLQTPTLPNVMEIEDDDDIVVDGETKLQPLNIHLLKDIMNKKVQKMSMLPTFVHQVPHGRGTTFTQATSKTIRSTTSLKSVDSNKDNE